MGRCADDVQDEGCSVDRWMGVSVDGLTSVWMGRRVSR